MKHEISSIASKKKCGNLEIDNNVALATAIG